MNLEPLFYMIYVEGESTPTYKHHDKESALTEAKRLAKFLKKKVYILQPVKAIELNEFIISDIGTGEDDLPF